MVSSKEYVTGSHLHMLLNVIDSLCHNLRAPSFDDQSAPIIHKLDGGVKMAVESTIIQACNAIDRIMEETARFSAKYAQHAEKKVLESIQANLDSLEAQAKAAAHIIRPCVRFQPRLVRVTDGTFACYLGDVENGTAIVGQGSSPEAALEAFDQVFLGRMPESMKQWAESKTNQDKTIPPEEQNAKQERPMDTGTGDKTSATPSAGRNGPLNCKGVRRRRVSRAKQDFPTGQWRKGQLFDADGNPIPPSGNPS